MEPFDNAKNAGYWGNEKSNIPGWENVDSPERGDIAAYKFKYVDATGHMGIMISDTRMIYAGGSHSPSLSNRPLDVFPRIIANDTHWVYWRYTGK